MERARKNKGLQAIANIFSFVLTFAFIVQPLTVLAAPSQTGTSATIAGCPAGKDCAVFTKTYGSELDPGYGIGVRSICETSQQICVEQGYEGVVCDPIAWSKAEWDSPSDNYQRDYVAGAWTTYGAWGGNDEYWTKITCQKTAAPVVIDMCPNVDGVQETVPTGSTVDESGNCVVSDAKPIGFLDSASCSVFNGWTYDPDEPSVSNVVHFYADGPAGSGTFIGAMNVDQPRPDINTAYSVAGNHGFSFPTPDSLKDGGAHDIYAYGINTNPANPDANNSVLPQAWNNLIDYRTISGCTTGTSLPPATISSLVTDVGTVVSGSSVTLSWVSENATSCTASGGWSGPVATSGSQVIGPLTTLSTTTQTFSLSCTNASGDATQSTTISVVPASTPVSSVSVSITGVPASLTIPTGGSASISITSTATVFGSGTVTQHGVERRLNGGAWTNAGAWNDPIANQARNTDASFTGLSISTPGAYEFRTYASIDGGTSYSYSTIVSMTATASSVTLVAPNLLSTTDFVILSKTGITNTGSHTSAITGNIGSSPITAAAMNNVFCSEITGTIYGVDAGYVGSGNQTCFAGNPPASNKTLVDNAVLDMEIAYADAAGRTNPTATELGAGNIGGMTLAPGLYKWSTDVTIPTNVTLSGGANDVWIFQIAGNLNIASAGSVPSGIKVVLSGGAQASNVFWQVGGGTGATLGTYSTFNGTILTAKQIIIQTGAVLNGRALAQTQVTLDANIISNPTTTGPPPVSAPTFTTALSASPSTLASGATAILTWGTTGATSCTASGGWSGVQATSGAATVGPITADTSYTLTCTGPGGSTPSSTTITFSVAPTIPTFTTALTANPSVIASGATSTLTWGTTGATSCTASGSWSGAVSTSGSQSVGPFTATAVTTETFTLSCTNTAGTVTSSVALTVNPPGGTATGTVSVAVPTGLSTTEYGSSGSFTVVLDSAPLALVTIPVSSSDTSEGTVVVSSLAFLPSNWNVPQTVYLTGVDDTVVDGDITYSILLGSITSADINWNGVNPSDVSIVNFDNDSGTTTTATSTISAFSVSPTAIVSGNTATLSWNSSNASLCVASGSWSGNKSVTGSETVGPFTSSIATTFVFGISCGNASGTTTASTTLSVTPPAPVTTTSTSSGGGGGGRSGGPCIGYGCTTTTGGGSVVPADVWILIDTVSSGGVASGPTKVCKYDDFLTSFMKRGISNNPNDVRKLQYFLNIYEAANLPVNGEFDLSTEEAVKAFQVKYTESVLSPWGTTTPTGIVYITTTAEINRIFCGDNPEYRAGDLDNVLENVLYTPIDTTSQFEGVVGFNSTTSTSTAPVSPNIAGVIGSMSDKMSDLLGKVPWYPVLILILVLLGTGLIVHSILIKDTTSGIAIMSLMRGSSFLGAGTLLNAANTLAYMLDPEWFTSHSGIGLSWVLGLDLMSLLSLAFLCMFLIAMLFGRSMKKIANIA